MTIRHHQVPFLYCLEFNIRGIRNQQEYLVKIGAIIFSWARPDGYSCLSHQAWKRLVGDMGAEFNWEINHRLR